MTHRDCVGARVFVYSDSGPPPLFSLLLLLDTGTTLVLLATEAFEAYQEATGATLDSATGLLAISSSQYAALGALDFSIGGSTFSLTPNAQIWPRSLNADIGGSEDVIYLVVADVRPSLPRSRHAFLSVFADHH